ncbi:MAG: 50S ribosomal protein L24 [Hyphomonadaceae bacterium JAD_PAG50586_4]|jgi:large subunit ribosomal protein L24|nr:MAG: 50S ribosomal protein L24 [Hyphomonadaceae bacterium JAD_PAG50586_4]
MAARIKKNDTVVVLAGKDKGRSGKVLKVLVEEQRVLVEGVNMAKRHTAPNVTHPQGGVIAKEASLHISNVALRDPQTGKATRVGFKFVGEGAQRRKVRVAKGSGVQIDV